MMSRIVTTSERRHTIIVPAKTMNRTSSQLSVEERDGVR